MTDPVPAWGELLAPGALVALTGLADRCGAVDGGLPPARSPEFLARRYLGEGIATVAARHPDGRLVAVAALRPAEGVLAGRAGGDRAAGAAGVIVTGLVDPAVRGQGIGGRLLDWAVAAADARNASVTIETESLTPAAAELFASRGFEQVFAEDILRFDLGGPVPSAGWPAGTTLDQWTTENAGRFFAVYTAAFGDRPGFPGWPAERWVSWTTEDDFRPAASVLAGVPGEGDAGFVTCADGWIIQVGVVPALRGRGLGRALVCAALRRLQAEGSAEVLLDVNVDNPAGALYRRLGFQPLGRRARFRRRADEPG